MSFNRENVTWQSADGQWYIGFYESYVYGDDPEWDVDYNFDRFEGVYGPAPTEAAVWDRYDGANPGGSSIVTHAESPNATARYDAMRAALITARRG